MYFLSHITLTFRNFTVVESIKRNAVGMLKKIVHIFMLRCQSDRIERAAVR